jgi:hypothetical protein
MNLKNNNEPECQNHGVRIILTLIILTLLSLGRASAQYAIAWSTIAGGGGPSAGGVYSVTGTIGQPDAGGPMTSSQYSVTLTLTSL